MRKDRWVGVDCIGCQWRGGNKGYAWVGTLHGVDKTYIFLNLAKKRKSGAAHDEKRETTCLTD